MFTAPMQTIPLYRGTAARAALRGLGWRRVALRGVNPARTSADAFEAANQFRLARWTHEVNRGVR